MQTRWVINASYYCERGKVGGLILVMNSGAYVLANYRELTGELHWQRVIPAGEKKAIEDWLGRNFPASVSAPRQLAQAQ
jgi:hypothetical protein